MNSSHASSTPALRRAGLLLAAALALPSFAGCGSGGSGGTSLPENPPPLKLTRMSAVRKDAWERNRAVEFEFSAPVQKKFVDDEDQVLLRKAIQIGVTTSKGRIPAKGSFWFAKDPASHRDLQTKIVFDPTRLKHDINPVTGTYRDPRPDNPFGFSPLVTYDVDIPAPPATKVLTAIDGKPIVEGYNTFFTTSEKFVSELVQPRYLSPLSFDPPAFSDGSIPYNARVTISFSEAMDPNSFELGNTVTVRNDTLSTIQGTTVLVPGNFVPDIFATSWRFVPSFNFGGAGYDISIILTTGLKDLAGNPLANPRTVSFRTEVKPGVATTQVINESFDNQTYMDAANTTDPLMWGGTTAGALLAGSVTSVDQIVALATPATGVRTRVRDHPFAQQGGSASVGHDQWIYTQGELGGAAAITAIGWGPSSNALFASDHARVVVQLGHTQGDSLSNLMDNNFDVGTPVKVADAHYVIPQRATIDPPCNTDACAVGYWPLPTFTNFFEYNGKNNLILDIDASLGTNYQITRIYYGPVGFPNRHTFCATGSATGTLLEPAVTDARFTKKRRTTVAQSRFRDSGQNAPNFSPAILSPATQTGGTSLQVEFEGADGISFPIPGNPNNVVPDPTTYTGFVTNLDQLDGYRFVRFRVTFTANVNTGAIPRLNSIAIPYIF